MWEVNELSVNWINLKNKKIRTSHGTTTERWCSLEIESKLYVYWFKITNPIHTWMTFMSFYYRVVVALQRVLVDGCDIKQKIDNIQSITIQINCRIWMEWMEENIKLHWLNGPPSSHISLRVHFHCHLEASIYTLFEYVTASTRLLYIHIELHALPWGPYRRVWNVYFYIFIRYIKPLKVALSFCSFYLCTRIAFHRKKAPLKSS